MDTNTIKIIAADDHPIVIDGIKLSLEAVEDFEFVGEASSIPELYSVLQECSPDLLILDLNFKGDNSLQYLERIYQVCPRLKVIIFSSYNTPSLIKSALATQVSGYLLKDTPKEEFIEALYTVHSGGTFISQNANLKRDDFKQVTTDNLLLDNFLKKNNLSYRELEIIQLIVNGMTSDAIAEHLYISKHTVQSHRKNILRKLSLHSKAEIVRFAYENNLV